MGKNDLLNVRSSFGMLVALLLFNGVTHGQQLFLDDLSAFKSPSSNWQIAGQVFANPDIKHDLGFTPGKGVLFNLPSDPKQAKDIYTVSEHGDADIELEFLIARGSNSGIYLQGRYEIQLLDSWGKKHPGSGDCGGIYERWDDNRPEGQKGYQGYSPRQNASRIAGVWQKMKISFQAPRFDRNGMKTENAKIISLYLNDQLIHENVSLTGPTRGAMKNDEVAKGPLRIQGDHGPVAFRNVSIKTFDHAAPAFKELSYLVHDGRVTDKLQLENLKVAREGRADLIDNTVSHLNNNYVIRYRGKLAVPVKGVYTFKGDFWGGYGDLKVNGQEVFPFLWHNATREVELPAGELDFEYTYSKVNEGNRPGLGLVVSGPGVRPEILHEVGSVTASRVSNPIELDPGQETLIHRSFIDLNGTRLPYGVSVGTPQGVHFSLDLHNGTLVRVWRGPFLNVTPMWLDRGNGTSVPRGSAITFDGNSQVASVQGEERNDYRFKGYKVDDSQNPTFLYEVGGALFEDRVASDESGRYLERTVVAGNGDTPFVFTLAVADNITLQANGMLLVDDRYFIKVQEGGEAVVKIKDGKKILTYNSSGRLAYAILW